MKKAVIFDMDGTLWDSRQGIKASWNEIYEKYSGVKNHFTDSMIEGVLGKPMPEIANILFSMFGEKSWEVAKDAFLYENEYLAKHPQKIYPGLVETLSELKEKYRLYIISNCQQGYIEAFFESMGLKYLFDDYGCWGDNQLKKGDNIKLIMKRNNVDEAIYVGDTRGDEIATREAGIPFVHASYGFGKAESPDATIRELKDLLEVSKKLLG